MSSNINPQSSPLLQKPPPISFFDLEMHNPKRQTGFAAIGKKIMNIVNQGKEDKLKMEEELIKADEKRNEREYKYYKNLMRQTMQKERSTNQQHTGRDRQISPDLLRDNNNDATDTNNTNRNNNDDFRPQFSAKEPDPVDQFNRALDDFVYDKYDNDINRRANKAHNQRGNLKFVGTGHPTGSKEMDLYKKVQKSMIYRSMLEDQIEAKKHMKETERDKIRRENEIERERIAKMNAMLELRKIEEDRKQKEKMIGVQQSNLEFIQKSSSEANFAKSKKLNFHNSQSQKNLLSSHLDTIHEVNTRAEQHSSMNNQIQRSVDLARNDMVYEKNRIKRELEEELAIEKDFMKNLPNEIRIKIQSTMDLELQRLKNEVNHGTNVLRDEIIRMRSMAVELDEEKRKAKEDLHKLRKNLATIQYQDDIRTHELLDSLAEDNLNRLLPSSTRFSMPEALFFDDPKNRFPISYYDDYRLIKGEKKLYTDGYFAQDAVNEVPLYQSLNFERRRPKEENLWDSSIGRTYERNNERDHVFSSMYTDKPVYQLEEYLTRELADPIDLSF